MTKKVLHKIWDIVSFFLVFGFVAGGTLFVYYYANGYRFNPINGEVKQTGVLNVESRPNKADIFVGDSNIGKSPKVQSVEIGEVKVRVSKDGYIDWEKVVPIQAEKSTTITPTLFLKNPQPESVYSLQSKIIKQIVDPKNSKLYSLVLHENQYKLLQFDPNKKFWNFSDNPTIIYTVPIKGIKSTTLTLSPDGNWAMITKTSETKLKTYDFVKLTIPHQTVVNEELDDFTTEYTQTWANDSNYIILESKSDIISFRYSDSTKYLLLKKNSALKYIWTTDSDGLFYYTSVEKSANQNKVSLIQTTLQGSNKKILLKDIYFQNSDEAITKLRESDTLTFDNLTNTKENLNFSGELTSFTVIPNGTGVFLSTNKATYWYNIEENVYILVHAQPSKFVSVSPDSNKILFYDEASKEYGVFTHNKIEADPLTQLGTKIILQNVEVKNIKWLHNSTDLLYLSGNEITKIEYDGYNKLKLIDYSGEYSFSNDLLYLYTFSQTPESDNLEIIRYRMY